MKKYTNIILLTVLALALAGQPAFTAPEVTEQALSQEAKTEIGPGYVYKSGNRRDPFIPLTSKYASGDDAARLGIKGMAAEVDVKLLTLKGYVFSQARKHALFKSADGRTYVLDRGKLLDDRGLTVPGVAGIVKADKVVLITKKNVMREFKLREESE
ncbi:MAG: hypothetical protein PHD29_06500 [bacterium]|nr:hypothetical protein [bacterium]MDD5353811.1 hypothetical protein [bacterium]MDD5756183.1 hypothetical protein [bacterium]